MKKIIILVFVILILLVVFFIPSILQRNAIKNFWAWFSSNQTAIASITTAQEPIADELSTMLNNIDPNLVWEMGHSNTPKEFIISADGIQSSFPSVIKVVSATPKNLTNWKITAFRQITNIDTITYAGKQISVDSLLFSASKNIDKYDLKIYVKNYQEDSKSVVYLFLDSWLGEYNTETKLGLIEILPFDEKKASDYIPFREIAKVIQ